MKRIALALCLLGLVSGALAEDKKQYVFRAEVLPNLAAGRGNLVNLTDDGKILTVAGVFFNGTYTPMTGEVANDYWYDIPKAFGPGGVVGILGSSGRSDPARIFKNGLVTPLSQVLNRNVDTVVDIDRNGNILAVDRLAGVVVVYNSGLTPIWSASLGSHFFDAAFLPDGRILVSRESSSITARHSWSIVTSDGSETKLPDPTLNQDEMGGAYSGYLPKINSSGCFPYFNNPGYLCLEKRGASEILVFYQLSPETSLISLNDNFYGVGRNYKLGSVLMLPSRELLPIKDLFEPVPGQHPGGEGWVINNKNEVIGETNILLRPIMPLPQPTARGNPAATPGASPTPTSLPTVVPTRTPTQVPTRRPTPFIPTLQQSSKSPSGQDVTRKVVFGSAVKVSFTKQTGVSGQLAVLVNGVNCNARELNVSSGSGSFSFTLPIPLANSATILFQLRNEKSRVIRRLYVPIRATEKIRTGVLRPRIVAKTICDVIDASSISAQ